MARLTTAKRTRRLTRLGAALVASAALVGCSQAPNGAPTQAQQAGSLARGAELFMQNCAPCHQQTGEGVPQVYPSLQGSATVNGDPAALAQWVLLHKRPATLPEGKYPTQMLAFGWMPDADAAAVLTYIRSHFGNHASPVDAAVVAQARAAP